MIERWLVGNVVHFVLSWPLVDVAIVALLWRLSGPRSFVKFTYFDLACASLPGLLMVVLEALGSSSDSYGQFFFAMFLTSFLIPSNFLSPIVFFYAVYHYVRELTGKYPGARYKLSNTILIYAMLFLYVVDQAWDIWLLVQEISDPQNS